jgi:hypothetical protein
VVVDAKYKRHWDIMNRRGTPSDEVREQRRLDLLQVLAYGGLAVQPNVYCCLAYPTDQGSWLSAREANSLFFVGEVKAARPTEVWLTALPMADMVGELSSAMSRHITSRLR